MSGQVRKQPGNLALDGLRMPVYHQGKYSWFDRISDVVVLSTTPSQDYLEVTPSPSFPGTYQGIRKDRNGHLMTTIYKCTEVVSKLSFLILLTKRGRNFFSKFPLLERSIVPLLSFYYIATVLRLWKRCSPLILSMRQDDREAWRGITPKVEWVKEVGCEIPDQSKRKMMLLAFLISSLATLHIPYERWGLRLTFFVIHNVGYSLWFDSALPFAYFPFKGEVKETYSDREAWVTYGGDQGRITQKEVYKNGKEVTYQRTQDGRTIRKEKTSFGADMFYDQSDNCRYEVNGTKRIQFARKDDYIEVELEGKKFRLGKTFFDENDGWVCLDENDIPQKLDIEIFLKVLKERPDKEYLVCQYLQKSRELIELMVQDGKVTDRFKSLSADEKEVILPIILRHLDVKNAGEDIYESLTPSAPIDLLNMLFTIEKPDGPLYAPPSDLEDPASLVEQMLLLGRNHEADTLYQAPWIQFTKRDGAMIDISKGKLLESSIPEEWRSSMFEIALLNGHFQIAKELSSIKKCSFKDNMIRYNMKNESELKGCKKIEVTETDLENSWLVDYLVKEHRYTHVALAKRYHQFGEKGGVFLEPIEPLASKYGKRALLELYLTLKRASFPLPPLHELIDHLRVCYGKNNEGEEKLYILNVDFAQLNLKAPCTMSRPGVDQKWLRDLIEFLNEQDGN